MIELRDDELQFSFPEVHDEARLAIHCQRTLRIPDDGRTYPLPPGLGQFPLRHVDDHAARVPPAWLEHGGVMLPMYQSEALWLYFNGRYPCAVRVLTGKVDAVTGKPRASADALTRSPQNYLAVPAQPWLDGYCVEKGVIRQFVAMPLGAGYTAEEQITGKAEHGGIQLLVYPMKAEVWERVRPRRRDMVMSATEGYLTGSAPAVALTRAGFSLGLAPGGKMRQEIYDDRYQLDDYDISRGARVFLHLANSLAWRAITGAEPPTVPPTAAEYGRAKLPWFDYYDERQTAVPGSGVLAKLKSVFQLGQEKGDVPLPENESVAGVPVVELRKGLGRDEVREGRF